MRTLLFSLLLAALVFPVANISAAGAQPIVLNATIGKSRPIPPDFLGLNGNLTSMKYPWSDQRFLSSMRRLGPANFRYPGGTIGNDWNWDTGWFDESSRVNPYGHHLSPLNHYYPLDNLALGQKAVGFVPVFMLNLITEDLGNQVAALTRAGQLGMPIRRVELGNEFYLPAIHEPAANKMFPTGADYAKVAATWAAAIKEKFPGVKIAAIGTIVGGGKNATTRSAQWNKLVLANLKDVDALTIHTYPGIALKGVPEAGEDSEWGSPEDQQKLWDAFQSKTAIARMLGEPGQNWRNILNRTGDIPDNMEIWITEFNMHDKIGPARYIWASGLYISQMLNYFLSDPSVMLACYHNAAGGYAPYWEGSDELTKHLKIGGGQDLVAQPGSLTAIGHALQLFGTAMRSQARATSLEFTDAPMVIVPQRISYRSLIGWTFSGADSPKTILVNLSDQPLTIRMEAVAPEGIAFSQIFASPLKFIVKDQDLTVRKGRVEKRLELPPYSMTLIGDESVTAGNSISRSQIPLIQ